MNIQESLLRKITYDKAREFQDCIEECISKAMDSINDELKSFVSSNQIESLMKKYQELVVYKKSLLDINDMLQLDTKDFFDKLNDLEVLVDRKRIRELLPYDTY